MTHNRDNKTKAGPEGRARGFSLVELLVVIAIIVLLMGLALAALNHVKKAAGALHDQQAVRSMAAAVEQFKTEFGFDLPLAYDGAPLEVDGPAVIGRLLLSPSDASAPVFININPNPDVPFVAVYSRNADIDFLRGGLDHAGKNAVANGGWQDARYSKASLAIYMGGALDREVDGAGGSKMGEPKADGSFKGNKAGRGSARTYDPFVAVGDGGIELRNYNLIDEEFRDLESAEHGNAGGAAADDRPNSIMLVDRYGRAFRYYRWERGRNTVAAAGNADDLGKVENAADLNIPAILQNAQLFLEQQTDPTVDATGGNTQLRSGTWAIVGAGPDGRFGTEDIADLGGDGGMTDSEQATLRAKAMKDNVVEVGQ